MVLVTVIGCAPADHGDETSLVLAPMGDALPDADQDQRARFERGRGVFARRFGASHGLGPLVNATACGACHEKPVPGGGASRYRNVYVVAGVGQEVRAQQQFTVDDRVRAPDEPGTASVVRNPAPLFGVGLLAEIPAEEILLRHDPNDVDGDGISGRVNFERGFVARFGHKAQIATLQGFVRAALVDHLGLTTVGVESLDLSLEEGPVELPTADGDPGEDPELDPAELADLLAFVSLLAGPERGSESERSRRGRARFDELGCAACHVPGLSGPRGTIPAFTDLLLHDMGVELADAVAVGEASGSEFRTTPLWGVAASGPWLHDGRADTIDEAIRLHGGEASTARDAYVASAPAARDELLAFLDSLGGGEFRPDGLLPREPDVPAPGAAGGPASPLSAADADAFARGRVVFDRDFPVGAGLGPRFNADGCRSCHFDDVLGGAGPADVDVIRQGIAGEDGFQTPADGTMVPRHATTWSRPQVDPRANTFERRQTPTILGLGLVDAIAESTIVALADPDDADGDGISGRVRRMDDGRIGRFGWKAGVPTLAEFGRDAMSNELGMTVPADGSPFGSVSDADAAPDPELARAELDDLVFFMSRLAPPVRHSSDPVIEAQGERVFSMIGCDVCHVPQLATTDGIAVPLYSDLLLHDVAPATVVLVPDGDAGREFRTPPLWGLAVSPPYLHDGRAESIAVAIELHDGEATSARSRFAALEQGDRLALLAFLQSL